MPNRFSSLAIVGLLVTLSSTGALAQAETAQVADPYFQQAQAALAAAEASRKNMNTGRAKNVILFIGDGMGVSTVSAARILAGQKQGKDGESFVLEFERLPHTGLSKTYSHDTQVVDSAASATAMLAGIKTRNRVLGVDSTVTPRTCESPTKGIVPSLAHIAGARGLSVGAVTTTRLTHATPAAVFAHSPFRDWEADSDMPAEAKQAGCKDIASQLIDAPAATRLNVALGGGSARFLPREKGGRRTDGRDLMAEWTAKAGPGAVTVTSDTALAALKPGEATHVLGLFATDHHPFEADRATQGAGVPTLAAMTSKAIDLLSANPMGYFLMVEGGRIDHASHANNAYRALTETIAMDEAVAAALAKVDLNDTLVIVTADHSHGLVFSGYAARNNPILGIAANEGEPVRATDGKAYTTLTYATGPGGPKDDEHRHDPAERDTLDPMYRQQALAGLGSSAHAGEDVPVYAAGPQAHLLTGVIEQHMIYHVMRRAFGF